MPRRPRDPTLPEPQRAQQRRPTDFTPRIHGPADVEAVLDKLPDAPGVYLMRDRGGELIYVGKASRLRARVRQYWSGQDTRAFVALLDSVLGDIETVVTTNEKEALLLENSLIKEHRPRFNVKLRDDKQYLVLRLDPKARWPRLELVRRTATDGASYFGPYHSAVAARATLRVINRHFKLRTCTDYVLDHRVRPCLAYQIGRCPAPCVFEVDAAAYAEQVRDVGLFLAGRHKELTDGLSARMARAAEDLEFETAARLRDQLQALERSLESQRVVGGAANDQDVVGLYREGGQVEIVVLHVRGGSLLGSQPSSHRGLELPDAELLAGFLGRYYDAAPFIPDEVLLPAALHAEDEATIAAWLSEHKGRRVQITTPARGDRRKLVDLADKNAAANFVTRRNAREDTELALERLAARLRLSRVPREIECYDISHTQGSMPMASMVVFVDGVPDKSRYRTFKIKGLRDLPLDASQRTELENVQNDDFASMYEVLVRRLRRGQNAEPSEAEVNEDPWHLPDLLVIDGGKGQLGRVVAALQDLGIPLGREGLDVVALAKERKTMFRGRGSKTRRRSLPATLADTSAPDTSAADTSAADTSAANTEAADTEAADTSAADTEAAATPTEAASASAEIPPDADFELQPERVFVPGSKEAIRLRPGSSERYLMERVRDEAHRFALSHHRKQRGKRATRSVLDAIDGLGPVLKKALIAHFGTISAIRAADVETLGRVKGVGPALAQRIATALCREPSTNREGPDEGPPRA